MATIFYNCIPATTIPRHRRQEFTYHTESDAITLQRGQLIWIPFRTAIIPAIITGTASKKDVTFQTKAIQGIVTHVPPLPESFIQLATQIAEYYETPLALVVKAMLPQIPKRPQKETHEKSVPTELSKTPSIEQQHAIDAILQSTSPILLHGPTGSGKTEVYLQAIDDTLKKQQQVIVLVPEISLTPQAQERYTNRFGKKNVGLFHSEQTTAQRFRYWYQFLSGEQSVLIGPRSAILAPSHNLGLIIIDEEHESTYKQWDQQPRYDARTIAEWRAKNEHTKLVFGSATPRIESIARTLPSSKDSFQKANLTQRISGPEMPPISVIDMRQELRIQNFSPFSISLQEAINTVLSNKRQVILFHSRRGTASSVLCRSCGAIEQCEQCDLPMTFHQVLRGNTNVLVCHHCGRRRPSPTICQHCASTAIKYLGSGTEKVEQAARELFPNARIARLDSDTTSKKGVQEKIYHDFNQHNIDILIGTQMITKGWDIEAVDLVGIMAADIMLYLPDFRSSERAFQLLTQVAGRTGRGKDRGKVILQTYNPEHPVVQAVSKYQQKTFYAEELRHRKQSQFPPFARCVSITIAEKKEHLAEKKSFEITKKLQPYSKRMRILGPTPAFYSKRNGLYRWNILLLIKQDTPLSTQSTILAQVPDDVLVDVDPASILA